jgi:hypothetical protein
VDYDMEAVAIWTCSGGDTRDTGPLSLGRVHLHTALASPAVALTPAGYWAAYSSILRGQLYGDHDARRQVEASPLGAAISHLFELGPPPFAWDTGRVRRVMLKEVLPGMETFVLATHGPWWTQLTNPHRRLRRPRRAGGGGLRQLRPARHQRRQHAGGGRGRGAGFRGRRLKNNGKENLHADCTFERRAATKSDAKRDNRRR